MTSPVLTCHNIYTLVKAIGKEVEDVPIIREEGRKLFRLIRRCETVVSDIQPYCSGMHVWATLKDIETVLIGVHMLFQEASTKGPLTLYLQADRTLKHVQAAAQQLDAALGTLLDGHLTLPDETADELLSVRSLLQRTKFELDAEHRVNLDKFRCACDSLRGPFDAMMEACEQMLQQTTQENLLSKEGFYDAIQELQQEVNLVSMQPSGSEGQEYYLRMMMDIIRIHHVQADTPLEYLCPLTHQLMKDPVVVPETGHSYERKAIEEWHKKGHHFCPRSGVPLRRLTLVPNTNLKQAVERWRLHNDMQLVFRPVLNQLATHAAADEPTSVSGPNMAAPSAESSLTVGRIRLHTCEPSDASASPALVTPELSASSCTSTVNVELSETLATKLVGMAGAQMSSHPGSMDTDVAFGGLERLAMDAAQPAPLSADGLCMPGNASVQAPCSGQVPAASGACCGSLPCSSGTDRQECQRPCQCSSDMVGTQHGLPNLPQPQDAGSTGAAVTDRLAASHRVGLRCKQLEAC